MQKNRSRGFTLIELLVVIAIIGILSAVVLASLNTARNKGSDASIKSNFDSIRTQSAIYYDTNTGYSTLANIATVNPPTSAACAVVGTMFSGDTNVNNALAQADKLAGGSGSNTVANPPTKVKCANDGGGTAKISQWSISVPLVNTVGTFYCIDSGGNATTTSAYASGLTC